MAQRRCLHTITRLLSSNPTFSSKAHLPPLPPPLSSPISIRSPISTSNTSAAELSWSTLWSNRHFHIRLFSSGSRDDSEAEEEEEEADGGEGEEEEEFEDGGHDDAQSSGLSREYSLEEKQAEAAAIGYKVLGQVLKSDRFFKSYAPVFAVVQIGSHQFKVSIGDVIYTERLKFCEVNDKLILNKVLLLGSASQTIVGRPTLPDAAVHAVVEEHALDAKVIIFKKKRRKNYRRTKGHRQELTRLRIADIQGIEKPGKKVDLKPKREATKKEERVAVAA